MFLTQLYNNCLYAISYSAISSEHNTLQQVYSRHREPCIYKSFLFEQIASCCFKLHLDRLRMWSRDTLSVPLLATQCSLWKPNVEILFVICNLQLSRRTFWTCGRMEQSLYIFVLYIMATQSCLESYNNLFWSIQACRPPLK